MVQRGNSYAILPSNHELNHDLETGELCFELFLVKYSSSSRQKKVQDFLSFHKEGYSQ